MDLSASRVTALAAAEGEAACSKASPALLLLLRLLLKAADAANVVGRIISISGGFWQERRRHLKQTSQSRCARGQ